MTERFGGIVRMVPTTDRLRGGATVPPPARIAVGLIAAAVAAVHLLAGSTDRDLWFDEALQLAVGRHHLDWGSADQPPVTPALAWLADTLAPASVTALRLVPSLATAAAVLVAALVARELGGDRRAQVLTALAQATGLWTAFTGHWLTPYTLEPVQWLLITWLLVRWMRTRDDRLLLLLGPVVGIAILTRFQVVLFGTVVLVAVLVVGPRELLRRPALWVSVVVAVLVAAPTLAWQAARGWPQLRMGEVVAAEAGLFGGRPGIAVSLLLLSGVLATVLVLAGIVGVVTDARLRPYAFLALAFVGLWVFFVATAGRGYYLTGLHGAIAALGAVAFADRRAAGHRGWSWAAWPGGGLAVLAAAGLVLLPLAIPTPAAPRAVAGAVARAYQELTPEQRQRTVVFGQTYLVAAYVDTADPALGLPVAHSGDRSYGYFDPPPDGHDVVLYVGEDPAVLATVLDVPLRPIADLDGRTRIWVGEGLREPWSRVWPNLRSLAPG